MGVASDIWRSLARGPRSVVRAHLRRGPQEAPALAILMTACGLVFVAQWPRLTRLAHETGAELPRLVAYELVAWLMVWPLVFYFLAWVTHGASRALGGHGTAGGARLALFWSWLAATPLALATGMLAGLAGPGLATNAAGALWLVAFAALWRQSQREAALGPQAHEA